jgi:hypothetical protein
MVLFLKKFTLIILMVGLFLVPFQVLADAAQTSVIVHVSFCGNNIKEIGEQCDGNDLGGATCQSLGYTGGSLSCTSACTFNTSNCTTGGGGGGGGGPYLPPVETKVIIQGLAYPGVNVTILKDGQVATTVKADNQANFKAEITNITAGIWTFSVWAEDNQGRRSPTLSFTINIISGAITTISNIFLPPTIDLTTDRVKQGENLGILGQSVPNADITIYVYSSSEPLIKKIKTNSVGAYFYNLNTSFLELGEHSTKAKASHENGLISDFSKTLFFQVLEKKPEEVPKPKCHKANLNCDFDKKGQNIINLIDFSILLYNWGLPKNSKADLNDDGIVNLRDFSIMLYYWTG